MNKPPLSRLERIPIKDYWKHEAQEFTPWLAQEENIALLGEVLGRDLEVVAKEEPVGPFQADILCKETLFDDHWVLIENQLVKTDHTHLGQLLTYAAGLKAVTVIWIAGRFRDEHRATLDWLNDITDDRFNFFGIEIVLWKIGNSPMAPQFSIVSKPNDWSGSVRPPEGRTPAKQTQLAFWTAFKDYMDSQGGLVHCTKPLPQNWLNHSIGRSGFMLLSIASTVNSEDKSFDCGEIRAELCITHKDAKEYYALLENQREEIDKEIGGSPTWYQVEGTRNRRVYVRSPADINDTDKWPEYHKWLREKLETLHKVFAGRVKALSLDDIEKPV
ncbi:MAG: DUF4268 domain-containing protein [Planctomycetota bacterium]|jgi:hypothetical protein